MNRLSVVAFLVVFAASTCARGDTLISGSVSNIELNGSGCAESNSSASSLNLTCGDSAFGDGMASLKATVGDTSGTVNAVAASFENMNSPGFTSKGVVDFDLSVDGTYVLTGGSGFGLAKVTLYEFTHGEGGGGTFSECEITLDGQTDFCDPGVDFQFSFLVPFNTPLTLSLDAKFTGTAAFDDGIGSGISYSFDDLTLVTTPEPSCLLLLGTGLIPIVSRLRRVVSCR